MEETDRQKLETPKIKPLEVDCFWSKKKITIQEARDFMFTPTNSECQRCRKCHP